MALTPRRGYLISKACVPGIGAFYMENCMIAGFMKLLSLWELGGANKRVDAFNIVDKYVSL